MGFWETVVVFVIKWVIQKGILKLSDIVAIAQKEAAAKAKDEANKQQAIDDLRGAGKDPGKTPEEIQNEEEAAADRFHDRLQP